MFTLKHVTAMTEDYIQTPRFFTVKWDNPAEGVRRVEYDAGNASGVRGKIDHGVVYVLGENGQTLDTIRLLFGEGANDGDGLRAPASAP